MLQLSTEKPLIYQDDNRGYARYRVEFSDLDRNQHYVLGWVSPRYPKCEAQEHLDRIKDWHKGWVREIYQENVSVTQAFIVRLYRKGLKDDMELLEEQNYLGMPKD
jgi:hypothetical protein